jgi:hypothetical protein
MWAVQTPGQCEVLLALMEGSVDSQGDRTAGS